MIDSNFRGPAPLVSRAMISPMDELGMSLWLL